MIQYHNNYPIFTSISNKLDLPSVHFLIKFLYPIIMDKFSKDDGYKQDDLMMVKDYIEDHLTTYHTHESITPDWCKKCQCLLGYRIRMKN